MTVTPAFMYIKGVAQSFQVLADRSVTSAQGFRAGALAAGIKASGKPDLGIWAADVE
jgi:N-acetylglutamate synthase/N-acetylornithine aminotransferase